MLEIIMYTLIFFMGAFFGSFFTLAIHRIPLGENITHERSYCPSCKHKLGFLDLFPLISYIFLSGKCRYCKKSIGMKYFIIELATGVAFLLFALSLNLDFNSMEVSKFIFLGFGILYFCTLFIIAGIDKEKRTIQKSVLVYGLIIETIYIIYLYIVGQANIYRYTIYLIAMLIFVLFDIYLLRRKGKSNYTLQVLTLCMLMVLFTGESIFILTVIYTLLALAIDTLLTKLVSHKKYKKVEVEHKEVKPIGFYLCITNTILLIYINFIIAYMS